MDKEARKARSGWLARLFAPPKSPAPLPGPLPLTLDELRSRVKAQESIAGEKLPQNLREEDFRGANLAQADFGDADVTDATFRDADLREANLSKVRGLIPEQLAGAYLTRCRLPAEVKDFPQLQNVEEISKNAGTMFLTMVLACVFVLITTVSTGDMQLLTNTGTAQLPVLNVAVATAVFFTIAPIVLIMLYVTAHLYLQRLWALMATLPAFFPDGMRIDRKTYPWLLNDLVQAAFPRLRRKGWQPFSLQAPLIALAAYNLVPFTVFIVWLRCLTKHDPILNDWQAAFFAVSVIAGPLIKAYHGRTMGESDRRLARRAFSLSASLILAAVPFFANETVQTSFTTSPTVVQRTVLEDLGLIPTKRLPKTLPSEFAAHQEEKFVRGRRLDLDERDSGAIQQARVEADALKPETWSAKAVRWALAVQPFFSGFGDLTENVSRRPAEWNEKKETASLEPTKAERAALTNRHPEAFRQRVQSWVRREADGVPRAAFVQIGSPYSPNFRFLRARGAFLVNADFRGADMTGADLSETDLRGALWRDDTMEAGNSVREVVLSFARLDRADLAGADLRGATLIGTHLSRASLVAADLNGAILTFASLDNAVLIGADLGRATLTGADLRGADLTGCVLGEATLTGANLIEATLTGADLAEANLSRARFIDAVLRRAYLAGANLTEAELGDATLTDANLYDANLTGADLTLANLAGADLNLAILDWADLSGANLIGSINLETAKLNGAIYAQSDQPKWPSGWRLNASGRLVFTSPDGKKESFYRLTPFIHPLLKDPYFRLELVAPASKPL